MSLTQPCPALSPDHLLDAPLGDLLAETRTEIIDSSITDAEFCGAAVQRKGGSITLIMPTGRSELESDTIPRYLLAQLFRVELPKLPPPFTTTEL